LKRIDEALEKSTDKGDTLDLSRRGITNIGPDAVERFAKGVGADMKGVWRYVFEPASQVAESRLALSYNALRDRSIHESFCRLSRLRYLNLKGNAFTEFPAAVRRQKNPETPTAPLTSADRLGRVGNSRSE